MCACAFVYVYSIHECVPAAFSAVNNIIWGCLFCFVFFFTVSTTPFYILTAHPMSLRPIKFLNFEIFNLTTCKPLRFSMNVL